MEHSTFAIVNILPLAVAVLAPAYQVVERSTDIFETTKIGGNFHRFFYITALLIVLEFVTYVSVRYIFKCLCTVCVEEPDNLLKNCSIA